jgi:hypothetical protein
MTPAEFRNALSHEYLVQLFDRWLEWRGDRLMPAWPDIRPEEIAPMLPHVWAWRIDGEGQPRVRLAGENIASMVVVTTRGKSLQDLYPPAYAEEIRAEFAEVLNRPACCHAVGALDNAGTAIGQGQRLCLPYGTPDGERGILGVSYHPMREQIYSSATTFSRLTGDKRFLPLAGD